VVTPRSGSIGKAGIFTCATSGTTNFVCTTSAFQDRTLDGCRSDGESHESATQRDATVDEPTNTQELNTQSYQSPACPYRSAAQITAFSTGPNKITERRPARPRARQITLTAAA
jgi:hypothetical protein